MWVCGYDIARYLSSASGNTHTRRRKFTHTLLLDWNDWTKASVLPLMPFCCVTESEAFFDAYGNKNSWVARLLNRNNDLL